MRITPYNTSIYNHLWIFHHKPLGDPPFEETSMTSQCPGGFPPCGAPWRSTSLTSARGSFFLLPRYGTRGAHPAKPYAWKPETRVGEKDMLP